MHGCPFSPGMILSHSLTVPQSAILALDGRVLERYEDMTRGMSDRNVSACRSALRYKYDVLIFNVTTDQYRASSSSSSTAAASEARAAFQTKCPPF